MIRRYTLPEMGAVWSDEARFGSMLSVELAVARDREPSIDNVDLEPGEMLGDLDLLGLSERDAGRLRIDPVGRHPARNRTTLGEKLA